jgi:modification methylase
VRPNAVFGRDKRPILVIDDPRAQIYHGNCLMMDTVLPRSKTSLIITSPPYPGVDQPEPDYATFVDPRDFNTSHDFLGEVWTVCFNLLEDLGRLVVNIYDIPSGASGMYPNVAAVIKRCLEIGFVLREEFIWAKGASYSPPSGSFPMPKGVLAANTFEMCLVFQKPLEFSQRRVDPSKIHPEVQAASRLGPTEHAWLMDPVWHISAEREGRKLGHPFTYPEELVERFVKLYSYTNEWVFDPFLGSGTTALVAQKLGRIGIGSELSQKYIDICQKRFARGSLF